MNVLACRKKRNQDYMQGYDEGLKVGIRTAVKVNLFQVIQFLGDKRGWKRERIMEALLWMHKHADMLLEDYTSMPEVEEAVKDEYGIIYEDGNFILLGKDEFEG